MGETTKTTHTPDRRWYVESVQIADYPIEVNDRRRRIALVDDPADARLIAAAPDLLAALHDLWFAATMYIGAQALGDLGTPDRDGFVAAINAAAEATKKAGAS